MSGLPMKTAQLEMPQTCEEDDDHCIVHCIPAQTSRGVSGIHHAQAGSFRTACLQHTSTQIPNSLKRTSMTR